MTNILTYMVGYQRRFLLLKEKVCTEFPAMTMIPCEILKEIITVIFHPFPPAYTLVKQTETILKQNCKVKKKKKK